MELWSDHFYNYCSLLCEGPTVQTELTLWKPPKVRIPDEEENLGVMVGVKLPEEDRNCFLCTKHVVITLDGFFLVQNSFQKENPRYEFCIQFYPIILELLTWCFTTFVLFPVVTPLFQQSDAKFETYLCSCINFRHGYNRCAQDIPWSTFGNLKSLSLQTTSFSPSSPPATPTDWYWEI